MGWGAWFEGKKKAAGPWWEPVAGWMKFIGKDKNLRAHYNTGAEMVQV